MKFKPSRRFFFITLAVLAVILVAFYMTRQAIGQFLPKVVDDNFFSAIIIAALGVSIWNRQIVSEDKRAAQAAKKAAAEIAAAAEGADENGAPSAPKAGDAG